jgi:hypothetical protein
LKPGIYGILTEPFICSVVLVRAKQDYSMLTLSQREVTQAFKYWESIKLKTLGLDG